MARDIRAEPRSTEEARRAVEETRGRISATLDAIEGRLVDKKEELKERIALLRPVREEIRSNHWRSLGIAFGAGLLLATLGRREGRRERHDRRLDEEERTALRLWRAERRERLRHTAAEEERRRASSGFGRLRGAVIGAVVAGLSDRTRRALLSQRGSGGQARD